ncbi:HoxN/HupN/NixA family nickel/cobalt transporter [Acetobacteraceae bacterium ESL0709]|nr:HoxN/HupN/NixA family nickel/cobalt transporter [Acetobacteraceae bacterium ESL0697]MDF7677638.1 HoxN/HupN/NixA family nickel/cobalt transporter [Acetobacteraceae bacterium ESL0709]
MIRVTPPTLLLACLFLANLFLWGLAALAALHNPIILGAALLAWVFGARHALDADHITAIDTITRQLMERGQRPYLIGLYFSLGHSTIVIAATIILIALPSSLLFQWLHLKGGLIGGAISSCFLLVMGLITAYSALRQLRLPEDTRYNTSHNRLFPLKRSHGWKGWQVILLGMLFGLGFDTASEISLLSLTSARHAAGQAIMICLLLPLLFTGAMALIDSLDNILMVRAWKETQSKASRGRAHYRLGVTILSSLIALSVGGMELGSLLDVKAPSLLAFLNWCGDHAEGLGASIIALFLLLWAGYSLSVRCPLFKDRPARG